MVLFWLVGDANRGIFYFAYKAYLQKSKIPEVPKEFASKALHTFLDTTIFYLQNVSLKNLLNIIPDIRYEKLMIIHFNIESKLCRCIVYHSFCNCNLTQ